MSKAQGIYLISNWRVATIYRVRAKREHIEWAKLTYRQKKKESKSTRRSSLYSCSLSAYNMGIGLAHLHLTGQMRRLHFCQSINSLLRTSPISRPFFANCKDLFRHQLSAHRPP